MEASLRSILTLLVCLALLVLPGRAQAFEREWHVGAGVGYVAPKDGYGPGGAIALHLAYGLSDMFDLRVEARGSLHHLRDKTRIRREKRAQNEALPEQDLEDISLSQATLGIAYKLDIIEWVPYLGVRAGYYRFGAKPLEAAFEAGEKYEQGGGMIGTMLGVDYAFSRSLGVGLELDYDTLLPQGGALGAVLHAEYRWGF